MGSTLHDKAEALRANLGLRSELVLKDVIEEAVRELGLTDEVKGLSVIAKADACLHAAGISLEAAPVVIMGKAVEGEVMGWTDAPIQPVAAPIQPVAAVPAVPDNPPPGHRLDGLTDASRLAGCWGCICLPGGCALEMKQAQGPDTLVHKGFAAIFFGLPVTYEEKWHRRRGTNHFQKDGDGSVLQYDCGESFACIGAGVTCKMGPSWCGNNYRVIPADELSGRWACACLPGGWACYEKAAQGNDTLVHNGTVFLFCALPIPFSEPWDRFPGTNIFHKRGDDGSKETYFTSHCSCSGLGGAMKC